MGKPLLMGIDVGTSAAKCAVFDTGGRLQACASRSYAVICRQPGWLCLDPRTVLDAVKACTRECAGKVRSTEIAALAVSTQGEALVLTDENHQALDQVLTTFDSRNTAQLKAFLQRFGRLQVFERTGMPAHTMFSATKLMWLYENRPELLKKTRWMVSFDSFVALALGIAPYMVNSLASRTMLYDLRTQSYIHEFCDFCHVEEHKLAPVVKCGDLLGRTGEAARDFGLEPGIRVIAGNHDQLCCTIGAGVVTSDAAMSSMGTTESIVLLGRTLKTDAAMYRASIPVYDFPLPGTWAYMTFLTGCASQLAWFEHRIVHREDQDFFSYYEQRRKLTRLIFLPYLSGSGTPCLNCRATGVFEGFTPAADDVDIYMAVLQSVCCEERVNFENMERSGLGVRELRCIGGGAGSALWLQLKADFTGKTVVTVAGREIGCLGAAIIAGAGCGIFGSLREGAEHCVHVSASFERRKEHLDFIEAYYARYQRLVKKLNEYWLESVPEPDPAGRAV